MTHLRLYARHQAALVELTRAVLANTDLAILMRHAVTLAADTLAVAYSAIWELLPDRSALVLRAGVGWQEDAIGRATIAVTAPHPICTAARRSDKVIVPDWPAESRFQQVPLLRNRRVISSVCVGIPGQLRPFGTFGVDVTASRMFSDEEVNFLLAVANVLALAVIHIQANQLLDQRIEERTHDIEQRLIAAAQAQAVMEERQRLARDLHDSVTQALYGVTLHAQAARRWLATGDVATALDSLRALQDTAQEALDEMRLLIFELRPPILEQVGLVAAVQARLSAVEGRANLQTKLVADEIDRLPAHVEQALYRIALEALNNVLKHAHARCVTVHVRQMQRAVVIEVDDDGVGFDPAAASTNGGIGLRGITERVAQLGGQVSVQSAPGAGAHLRVEVGL